MRRSREAAHRPRPLRRRPLRPRRSRPRRRLLRPTTASRRTTVVTATPTTTAARATATAGSEINAMTKRRTRMFAAVVGLALVAVAVVAAVGGSGASRGRPSAPFAWLHPSSPPAGWKVARTAGGATFGYPPGWRPIKTDPGTASVALVGRGGRIDGFLNATPEQGAETLANWSRFRPHHN